MIFSDEDIFFLENWGVIEKLNLSEKTFRKSFTKYLYSIEDVLVKKDWWSSVLMFRRHDSSQVYISSENWRVNNEHCIWIGIEGFVPEKLFGSDDPANFYLWVNGEEKDRIRNDLTALYQDKEELSDYLTTSGGYIIKKFCRKFTEGEYSEFISEAHLQEMATFLEEVYLVIADYELHRR